MAKVVAFLCSEDADMIRGQVIVLDGGISLIGV
jgi:enoyl-[acyl-carrier-protein] reductase (NADH)